MSASSYALAPGQPYVSPAPVQTVAREGYLPIFLGVIAFYVACTIGLRLFMLDLYRSDFLETSWLAFGDDPQPLLTSTIAVLFIAHFTAVSRRLASDFFLTLLAAIPIIPMIALYAYRGAHPVFLAATLGCFLLIWAGVRLPLPPLRWRAVEVVDVSVVPKLAMVATGLFLTASVALGNLRFLNFNFAEVYDYRAEAIETRGALLEYAGTNITGFLLPLALAITLDRKMWRQAALLFGFSFLIFGFTSHKSHFFIPFFVVALFFAARQPRSNFLFLAIGAAIIAGTTMIYRFGFGDALATLTVRRIFFVPAYANYLFYDFFSYMPKILWADNRVTLGLVHNPYGAAASRVILNYYAGGSFSDPLNEFASGNTGFLGAGYAEGGVLGMMLYAVIITLLLRCSNLLASKIGRVATCAGLGHLFGTVVFGSSDTLTTFISYGVGLYVVLSFVIKEEPMPDTVAAAPVAGGQAPALAGVR